MTQEQLAALLNARQSACSLCYPNCLPTGDATNAAWKRLGAEMGFKWVTVQRVPHCCQRHFTAEPIEPAVVTTEDRHDH